MQIEGTLIHVLPLQEIETKSGNPFRKQAIIVRTDGEYPQEVKLEVTGKGIEQIQPLNTRVSCHIDIRGRGYTNKAGQQDWFTTVNCWRIDKVTATQPMPEDVPF